MPTSGTTLFHIGINSLRHTMLSTLYLLTVPVVYIVKQSSDAETKMCVVVQVHVIASLNITILLCCTVTYIRTRL